MAKILVIDDSLFQRRTICKLLQADGHDIQEATNGRQGLEMLTEFAPHCVVLDILMPDIDGLDFLKTLQEQGDTTPVVVLTADIPGNNPAGMPEIRSKRCVTQTSFTFRSRQAATHYLRNSSLIPQRKEGGRYELNGLSA